MGSDEDVISDDDYLNAVFAKITGLSVPAKKDLLKDLLARLRSQMQVDGQSLSLDPRDQANLDFISGLSFLERKELMTQVRTNDGQQPVDDGSNMSRINRIMVQDLPPSTVMLLVGLCLNPRHESALLPPCPKK